MVNAWSLSYELLYGDMDKEYPIMKKREDESEVTSASDDMVSADLPTGNHYAAETVAFDWSGEDAITFTADNMDFRTDGYPGSMSAITSNIFNSGPDIIKFGTDFTGVDDVDSAFSDDITFEHILGTEIGATKPQPDLKSGSTQKYEEDKGIKDLRDYVSSTYQGHYTNDGSNVQTLDLIHSVGDAESFCRSNAIKYLSRYDKKGQAKRDILKAMHYCLLLYYFSGNTNDETPIRGYETF